MSYQYVINTTLAWKVKRDAHSDRLIAVCDPLSVTIEGDSEGELKENIAHTIHLVFSAMLKSGDFERFLKERGWTSTQILMPSAKKNQDSFQVPWELVTADQKKNGKKRAAYQ